MQRAVLAAITVAVALFPSTIAIAQSTRVEVVVVDVQVTTSAPAVVDDTAEGPARDVAPILRTRGELLLVDGDYDFAAWGGSALIGARFEAGIAGGLVVGYLAEIGDGPAEVDLALELEKDFSPLETLGFVLLGRLGTAFMLGDGDPQHEGVRLVGQLGIGARVDLDPRIALTLDLRGVLRFRPGGDTGTRRDDVMGGAAITLGLALRLD